MIRLHRLNGTELTLNAALIEAVDAAPDTVITLATGNRYIVRESVDEVSAKVLDYQRSVQQGAHAPNPISGFTKSRGGAGKGG